MHSGFVADPQVKAWTEGDASVVLYHPDLNKTRYLNPSGLSIWRQLARPNTVDRIARALTNEFEDAPKAELRKDVADFLAELCREEYCVPVETSGTTPAPDSGDPGSDDLSPSQPGASIEPLVGTAVGSSAQSSAASADLPDSGDSPASVDISLTAGCNLRCEYCFYASAMETRRDLGTEEWLQFFGELGRLPVRSVCLSGGEIFTRPDLWRLIDAVAANRLRFSILSNGTLIDEPTIGQLSIPSRRRRLDSIQVSVDGSCPAVHDRSRGEGSFVLAIRGLRLLKEAGFPVACRVTVNRYNVDDLENTARLLLEEIGLRSFGTNDAMPMGAGCANQSSICLSPEQQVTAMRTLHRLAERYGGRVTAMAGPLAKWRMYHEMEHARATGERPQRWQMGRLTACGCVFNKLSVHHDGTVTPCNLLAELELGRINRDSLKDIWKTHPTLAALKARRAILMESVPGCADCEWTAFCNGSCPGLAYELTGDFNRANPHDCYRRFIQETGVRFDHNED
mgnify:CR=1 FL=1